MEAGIRIVCFFVSTEYVSMKYSSHLGVDWWWWCWSVGIGGGVGTYLCKTRRGAHCRVLLVGIVLTAAVHVTENIRL